MIQNKSSRRNRINQENNTQLHIVISFIYPKRFYDLHHKIHDERPTEFFMISNR